MRLACNLGALTVVLMLGIALGDSRAWSGSDAGGKAATVKTMAEAGTWDADVGYWAEDADPAGLHHPLVYTERQGKRWVQVTGLPLVLLGVPLWWLAGPVGLLALSVAGVLLAAYAARRLARALGDRSGWAAFWLVGAASPVAFYAGDVWEHAPAAGCALLALALTVEGPGRRRSVAIGLLFGAAVVLRQEMAAYAVGLVLAVGTTPSIRSAWWRGRWRQPLLVAAGVTTVSAGNWLLERVVLGAAVRGDRAAANVSAAGSESGQRLVDALVSTVGLFPSEDGSALLLGLLLAGGLALLATGAMRPDLGPALWVAGAAVAIGLYTSRLVTGLGFVPGLVPAAPLAAAGLMALRRPVERVVVLTALLPLPLVWTFAWTGQMVPQWGGRYVLLTSALLLVAGSVAVARSGWRHPAAALLVVLTVLVGGAGAAWHAQRTSAFATLVSEVEAVPGDVVIVSTWPHLGREAGAWYGDHRWLRTDGPGGVVAAVAVARQEGVERIDLLELDGTERAVVPAPSRLLGSRSVFLLGIGFTIRSFALG